MTKEITFALIGLGNIGRNLLDILDRRQAVIGKRHGLCFRLIAAADSKGAAVSSTGLDPRLVCDIKDNGGSVSAYPAAGQPGMTALEMVKQVPTQILVDASPTNLKDGQPGLGCTRAALERGRHLVAANKGPLVLAYQELMSLAAAGGNHFLFSGTVAGGLPTVNIGVRDLVGSGVERVEGIFNGTTNYILTSMAEDNIDYETALAAAQEAGIAEADPTLDVDGWDAANKLVIIANSVLGHPTKLDDLTVEGIRGIDAETLAQAKDAGRVVKLLAIAEQEGEDYRLEVKPVCLEASHPMARTGRWDMGVVYYTDVMGVISAVIEEKGPVPTSAAVLRDMINIASRLG